MRLRALVLALALLCALTLPVYADEGVTPPAPTPAPAVSGVAISPSSPDPRDVGKTVALSAAVSYENQPTVEAENAKLDRTVTWTSASPSIATVDGKGVVSAVAPGKTKITAVSNANKEKSAQCEVTVSGITLSKTSLTMLVGRTESLTYSPFGTAADKGIVWTTSNPSVAEVFGGSISAHYEGTATITATANGTGYTAECSVTVKKDEAEAIRSSVDGTWTNGEKVTVQAITKTGDAYNWNDAISYPYEINNDIPVALTKEETHYWQRSDETKLMRAWYCADGSTSNTLPDSWSVAADQNETGKGYAASDLLFTAPVEVK